MSDEAREPKRSFARVRLTKRTVEAFPIPAKGTDTYRDTDDRYLRMVITPENRHIWRYIRKVAGRTRFYTIGTYPEVTPEEARLKSKSLSASYDAGDDPQQEKREQRKLLTYGHLFAWYIENHAKPHKRTWEYDVQMDALYCQTWQARAHTIITADTVTRWHKIIGRDNGKHQADRALAMVKTVFSKAIEAGVIKGANPAATVHKFFTDPDQYGRKRHLSGNELGRLFTALDQYHDQDMSDFFRLALFTGARRGNVQAMRWVDMDRSDPTNPRWIIPGSESKNKEPMAIPLLPVVLEILNRRFADHGEGEYVFPAKRGNAKTGHLTEPKKAWSAICEAAKFENVHIHDLRRTLGSMQALLGSSLQIIGRSLGHKSMQSTKVYAQLDMDPVRASMGAAVKAMIEAGKAGAK